MDRRLVRIARRRAAALGALAALIVPACASDGETIATVPAGSGTAPPVMASSGDATKTASSPLGYPWATGASLPTATAKAPGNVIR